MRRPMALSLLLFLTLFFNFSFAETQVTMEVNTSLPKHKQILPLPTFSETYWQLHTLFDEEIDAEKSPRETYISFSVLKNTKGDFKGATGCNDLLGKYSAFYFQLSFDVSHIAMTRLACPEQDVEHSFLKALEETKAWRIEDAKLIFLDANHTAVATFTVKKQEKEK